MATSSFLGRADAFDILESRARPKLSIQLAGQDQAAGSCYTTGDRIKGEVIIVADRDVKFEKVEITFQGIVAPTVAGSCSWRRDFACHR